MPKSNRQRFMIMKGTWDSWGFGFSYAHYVKSFTLEFIHWYLIIAYVPKRTEDS